jgi:hypothetical protein
MPIGRQAAPRAAGDGAHAVDHFRQVGDGEHDAVRDAPLLFLCRPLPGPSGPGLQGKPLVVDRRRGVVEQADVEVLRGDLSSRDLAFRGRSLCGVSCSLCGLGTRDRFGRTVATACRSRERQELLPGRRRKDFRTPSLVGECCSSPSHASFQAVSGRHQRLARDARPFLPFANAR